MRTSSLIRLVVLILLCGASWVAYSQLGQTPAKLNTVKIKNNLYMIHNEIAPGNTTVLVTDDGLLLVDDKFAVDHDNLMAEVKKISTKPVKYVISTHHHGDHTGGNPAMQKMGVTVIASEQARQNMIDGKQPGPPDIAIERHSTVTLGGKTVEMYYFGRAHTNGDIVILFPEDRVLAAGDMFTFGDATPQLIDYSGGGSAKEWTPTLDAVLKLDFDTVVPGHGNLAKRPDMVAFRNTTLALRNRAHQMQMEKKSRDEIGKVLKSEFKWGDLQFALSLDGLLGETAR
ncbi:MAG TPA: MBL fold metallo-hydrolase [Bryobacteraceae bacterium]|nr:MBL fold metallo-hydrolase [Bryobacteraceae bacterium]